MTRAFGLFLALWAAPACASASVVEYYDAGLDRYFLTAEPGEMAYVETGGAGRVLDDYHFNNEIAGDGEIGLTLGSMGLKLLRR